MMGSSNEFIIARHSGRFDQSTLVLAMEYLPSGSDVAAVACVCVCDLRTVRPLTLPLTARLPFSLHSLFIVDAMIKDAVESRNVVIGSLYRAES